MAEIKIYDERKNPLGTARFEHDGKHAWLDGFRVRGISRLGDGWLAYQVNWMDRRTGEYHSPVYVREDEQ